MHEEDETRNDPGNDIPDWAWENSRRRVGRLFALQEQIEHDRVTSEVDRREAERQAIYEETGDLLSPRPVDPAMFPSQIEEL
jgi:hypothetical protein